MRARLTHPNRFGTEGRALGFIRDNSLFGIGAIVVPEKPEAPGSRFRVVVDTWKPEAVARYLSECMPGVQWQRHELPA